MSLALRSFAAAVLTLSATAALAGTPGFFETLDGRSFPGNRVPTSFAAQIGTAYVYAPSGASIIADPTCDSLSTDVMQLNSTVAQGGWDVRFVHQQGSQGVAIGEQEQMAIKVGQENPGIWGVMVGFASTDGYEVFPVQLGPPSATDTDPNFGRIYVFGQPTNARYGNVFASSCSGVNQVNYQVNVTFTLYGQDNKYFVTVTSFGPTPVQQKLGPFDLPPQFSTGYGACMIRSMAGTGRAIVDGVECIAQSVVPIDPITESNRTSREPNRRSH